MRGPGFKVHVQSGIVLQVARNVAVDVVLQIGAVTESIEVTGNTSMVETKDSAIAQVMEQRKIVDLLPLRRAAASRKP